MSKFTKEGLTLNREGEPPAFKRILHSGKKSSHEGKKHGRQNGEVQVSLVGS